MPVVIVDKQAYFTHHVHGHDCHGVMSDARIQARLGGDVFTARSSVLMLTALGGAPAVIVDRLEYIT